MASPATYHHQPSLPHLHRTATPQSVHDFRSYTNSYGDSRDTSPSFRASPVNLQHDPRPQLPPSPPMERSTRISLPPISTLLGPPRHSPVPDDRNANSEPLSNGVHCFDFAKTRPRLTSPPTPPMRPECIDLRRVPGPQRTLKRLPPMYSPYESPHYQRRLSPSAQEDRSSVRHQRQSASSFFTSSIVSTRPVSPSSVHSAPAEIPHWHSRVLQPATVANQRPLPSGHTPLTPRSPPSATSTAASTVSRLNDRDTLLSRGNPFRYTPKLPQSVCTQTHGSQPYSLPYPPQPTAIPSGEFPAMSDISQQSLPDRYICPSCAKAFSRPSSLRIHVHSHTGEKPFRCPHKGCGKVFSVRSNMKRHQRGCHVDGMGSPIDFPRGPTSGMEIARVLA